MRSDVRVLGDSSPSELGDKRLAKRVSLAWNDLNKRNFSGLQLGVHGNDAGKGKGDLLLLFQP